MSENTEEKFGKIFFDGRIIDLDSLSLEERAELVEKLEQRSDELEDKIDKILKTDEEQN